MIRKTILALSAVAACSTAQVASAGIGAYAWIGMEDFVILGANGEALDYVDDFSTISFTGDAEVAASYGNASISDSVANSTSGIDFPVHCLGDCPAINENEFPQVYGAPTSNFAAADQVDIGSPIANTPNYDATPGAFVGVGGYVSLDTVTTSGSASSENNLESIFTFDLAEDQALTFNFNIYSYLEAFVGADELAPGKANAEIEFSFKILDVTAGFSEVWNSQDQVEALFGGMDPLNQDVAINAFGFNSDLRNCGEYDDIFGSCGVELNTFGGDFGLGVGNGVALSTDLLTKDRTYQLVASMSASVNAERVPAPGVLALMGLGLLGLAGASRRRKA